MRLVTWNCCRGSVAAKLPLLTPIGPSVAVLSECSGPPPDDSRVVWLGEPGKLGIAVCAADGYRISALARREEVPRYTLPVQVEGPVSFLLLAVWSKTDPHYRYVKAVIRAVECYRDLIVAQPTVVMGDFNSNTRWDYKRAADQGHSGLVRRLADLGLVSAYHEFFGEPQGAETRPTLYLLKQRERPYHIDYCFLPNRWLPHIKSVAVGGYQEWSRCSDHTPLTVDVALPERASEPTTQERSNPSSHRTAYGGR